MEERDPELPVATLRPRRVVGRVLAVHGALGRWLRSRWRAAFDGRGAPLVLTGIFFSGMLLTMGHIARQAHHAANAIDEMHRASARANARAWQAQRHDAIFDEVEADADEPAGADVTAEVVVACGDPAPACAPVKHAPKALFYVGAR